MWTLLFLTSGIFSGVGFRGCKHVRVVTFWQQALQLWFVVVKCYEMKSAVDIILLSWLSLLVPFFWLHPRFFKGHQKKLLLTRLWLFIIDIPSLSFAVLHGRAGVLIWTLGNQKPHSLYLAFRTLDFFLCVCVWEALSFTDDKSSLCSTSWPFNELVSF